MRLPLLALLLALPAAASPAAAQTPAPGEICSVSILNQTAFVRPDGSWILPNVPTNMGPVRARLNCIGGATPRSGASPQFSLLTGRMNGVPPLALTAPPPTPARLMVSAPVTRLTAAGAAVQLTVTAVFADGATADVTAAAAGTVYRTTNPRVAVVSAGGAVTAVATGRVLVTAMNEAVLSAVALDVVLSGDSDGDGLPDDWELANGLDPNNPADAADDADGDGLTNLREFQAGLDPFDADTDDDGLADGAEVDTFHTDPLLVDTDGDGLSDGLEVATGSDPLDPASFNLAGALLSLEVAPAAMTVVVNTVVGEGSRQLRVTGRLRDGRSLDLTARRYGTAYASSDLAVANFGAEDGRVFGSQDGTATITVSNSGFSAEATVLVRNFAPTALARLAVPGFANAVAVAGDHAFIAAGAAGLQVVDVSTLESPLLAGAVDTPGNANDVRVEGSWAYVADGVAGLQVVDVSAPANPVVVATLPLPGVATDLTVAGGLVYLADEAGLRIVDVGDPLDPVLLGGVETPGRAAGVDVAGSLAVVADTRAGVHGVDVSDPTNPRILGSTATRPNNLSRAADVSVREGVAYVADAAELTLGGLRVLDFGEPATPVVAGSTDDQFGLVSVALERSFALAADYFFTNAVPIFEVGTPEPQYRAVLDFSTLSGGGGAEGHGLAVRDGVVFLATTRFGAAVDNGTDGLSALYIGRYAQFIDEEGIPPTVTVVAPETGSTVLERRTLRLAAEAADDIAVDAVTFRVNGAVVGTDFSRPYELDYFVPQGSTQLVVSALAFDMGGNGSAPAPEVVVTVLPDDRPTVRFLAPTPGRTFTAGSTVQVVAGATDDVGVISVDVYVDGVLERHFAGAPYVFDYVVPLGVTEFTLTAIAADELGQTASALPVTVAVRANQPPTVVIVEPPEGTPVVAGSTLFLSVAASDDLGVAAVQLLLDGVVQAERTDPPYEFSLGVPPDHTELRLSAAALDTNGQETRSPELTYPVVVEDPLTVVVGTVVDPVGSAVAGAVVTCQGASGATAADGAFEIVGVPTRFGSILCRATFRDAEGRDYVGTSQRVAPVPAGVTDVGQIELQLAGTFLYPGAQLPVEAVEVEIADVNEDQIPDLVAGAYWYGVAVLLGTANGGYEAARYFATVSGGQYDFAGSPTDVLVGDFNGDALPDIAAANDDPSGVAVLLGNGDGTFQPHLDSPAGNRTRALVAADFNGDEVLDIAAGNATSGDLSILLGNGDGTLALAQTLPASFSSTSVALGDINQDGQLDLLSAGSTVRTFWGNGNGSFTFNRSVSLGVAPADDLAVGDLNGDARLDFAVVSEYGNNLRAFFGLADGSFVAGPTMFGGGDPLGVVASDVDADGDLDLASANEYSNDISLYLGNGSGSFSAENVVFTGAGPNELAAGDLNRDGIVDLVAPGTVSLSLVFGLGNAAFDVDRRYPVGADPLGIGSGPQGVAVADFNADGARDFATASIDTDEVVVLLGRGDGTFDVERRFPAGSQPLHLAATDFNADGKQDVVVTNLDTDTISVLLGQGDGNFGPPSASAVGVYPFALVTADLNGDGHADIAVANNSSDDVSVLYGNGDGTFAPQVRYATGGWPSAIAVGDFQDDGHLDLVTANDGTDDLSVLLGNADGSFGPEFRPQLDSQAYPFPQSVAVADLDGDGKQDLAMSYLLYDFNAYFHGILLGNGDGTFQPLQVTPAGINAFGLMIVADANGDGIPDLVNTSPGGAATQDVTVVLGRGDGTFDDPQQYAAACYPYYLASGDFNGDGQVDIAAMAYGCRATHDASILIHH